MNRLWYTEVAKSWIEALPLGNGRLGAMISGEPFCGQIQMNEESIVYGGPLDRINPDAAKYFPEIRKLVLEGKIREAQKLELFALSGTPQSERPYQTMCDVNYSIDHEEGEIRNYRRELDHFLEACGKSLTPFLEISSTEFIIQMVKENCGITYLPYFAVQKAIQDGSLTTLNVPDIRIQMYRQIFYHKDKWKTLEMEEFIRLAKENG